MAPCPSHPDGAWPDGQLDHIAGPTPEGFRVIDVWEFLGGLRAQRAGPRLAERLDSDSARLAALAGRHGALLDEPAQRATVGRAWVQLAGHTGTRSPPRWTPRARRSATSSCSGWPAPGSSKPPRRPPPARARPPPGG